MTRTVKSDHQRATEALQAARRRHDKAHAKAIVLAASAQEAQEAERKAAAAPHYAEIHPALADEAGDGGEMAAT